MKSLASRRFDHDHTSAPIVPDPFSDRLMPLALHRLGRPLAASLLIVATIARLDAQRTAARGWTDPSPHRIRHIVVAPGVQLEVLDWGGNGPPLVSLAGLGNTAHVYDDF